MRLKQNQGRNDSREILFFFENVQRTNSKKIEATGIWAWLDTNFSTK